MKKPAGFTLVEVVVATLLVSTVLALLLSTFTNAAKWISPEPHIASGLAREKAEDLIEEVRLDRWNDATKALNPSYDPPEETITLDGVAYARDYTVQAVSGRSYRKAQVTVTWSS